MKNSLIAASLMALSLAITAAVPAQAQEEAAAPEAMAETVDVDPALWVVKDEDTTIYLFGTIHILKPGLSWFDEAVKDAFNASDELVLEIIEPDPASMQTLVMTKAVDPGNPLRDQLSEEQKATYDTAMKSIGLPVAAFDQFEPWFAAINLGLLPLLQAGYDVNSGAEKVLAEEATAAEKTVIQLETPEQQLSFFDTLPKESQINYLLVTAQSIDEIPEQIDSMVTSWGDADIEQLGEMMNAGFTDKVLYDTLLTKRNANWAAWIDARMEQPGTVFIAVGAGHLAGETSVQAKLAEREIVTTRIEY
ncbi:TraB/GumN family protein [Alterisphingorhabdus coralli]|uniref:TraB/GumN family protein n=1 Tax=Alterisphingorhabdus coralli TaxID=3071408 RepID=A0AA97F9K0_9SPHN|nr:TraB/GumN family protein [Parasphingorhabdus sp. SCSIO 66989]WOE76426.1 TraB/GumN family protein [Parasphingorhabdus sp. SCSIO 66989]